MENKRNHNFRDISGMKFGRLTAISLYEAASRSNRLSSSKWLCECECGKQKIAEVTDLSRSTIKSCGCLHKEHARNLNLLPESQCNFNVLYKKYQRNATKRFLNFELTEEQFQILTKGNCHYCGLEPIQIEYVKSSNGKYTYNGLDRKNNMLGYTLDNVVSCCKKCNLAKSTMAYDSFIKWLNNLSEYRQNLNNK